MPLVTRSRKTELSPGRSTSPNGTTPSGVRDGDGDTEESTNMSARSKESDEKRDFQPPQPAASSNPVASKRELAPSSERVESQAMVSFPVHGSGSVSAPLTSAHGHGETSTSQAPSRWKPAPQSRSSTYPGGRPGPTQGSAYSSSTQYTSQMSEQGPTRKTNAHRGEREGGGTAGLRRSPVGMKEVGSLGSIAAELDLAAKEHDDFGPTVADCLNLGSFGEESPSRGIVAKQTSEVKTQRRDSGQRRSSRDPKSSPRQTEASHPSSFAPPPFSSFRGGPQHPYQPTLYYPPKSDSLHPQPSPPPYGPGAYAAAAGAYPYSSPFAPQSFATGMLPPPEQWTSAPEYTALASRRDDARTTPRKTGPNNSSQPLKASTPHKTPNKRSGVAAAAATRSPFRSPVANSEKAPASSGKKLKRSPLFGAGTPSIGYYGSFGMDTPGGNIDAAKLDEFSPMGPSFPSGFGDFPLGGDGMNESGIQFDPKLNINRVASGDDGDAGSRKRPVIKQRREGELTSSPFSSFLGDMSPLGGDIRLHGSPPVQQGRPSQSSGYGDASAFMGSPHLGKGQGQVGDQPPIPSSKMTGSTNRHLLTSPVASTTGRMSAQNQSWYDPTAPSPGPVRLELGDVGMKPVETRKSLEGINNMVRGMTTPHQRGYDARRTAGSSFRTDMSTPIKFDSKAGASGGRSTKGQTGGRMTGFQGPTPGKHTPVSSSGSKMFPQLQKSSSRGVTPTPAKSPATGKENASPKPQKRSPCNCKKSKCLKLYCECFAGERFCDKCNCYDCHNTQAHEVIRAKAMKDTRAKNPNAFKPRIAVRPASGPTGASPPSGHNMGCRCKRSECLKKYCECFQAGVMCGSKCKCVECLNYVGSQPLIDKRRKIKDHKGAEFAMRSADDAWKGKPGSRPLPPVGAVPSPAPGPGSRPPRVRPHMHLPPMVQPSPGHAGGPRGPTTGPPLPYGMAPFPMAPPMGYSPMGMPPAVTPGFRTSKAPPGRNEVRRSGGLSAARGKFNSKQQSTPRMATPRTPAVRLGFDPHSSKKKRKLSHGDSKEVSLPYFGPNNPQQPKTMALAVFSYLSNDDLYNAGIVCKRWSRLALDDELWQF